MAVAGVAAGPDPKLHDLLRVLPQWLEIAGIWFNGEAPLVKGCGTYDGTLVMASLRARCWPRSEGSAGAGAAWQG